MGELVDLAAYRGKMALNDGVKLWRRRFKTTFGPHTRLGDLEDLVLCRLAEPSESNHEFLYSFILALLGHGSHATFHAAGQQDQVKLVDIQLFLSDQIRFEMMLRLGWLARFCATRYPLHDMVCQFDQVRERCLQEPPLLSDTHPRFPEYQLLIGRDQQVFIRQMMPFALEAFNKGAPS